MFDNNVFVEGSCRNCEGGYCLETYITYYRAIPLSMINDIRVEVDGVAEPRAAIQISPDGIDWFTLDEAETVTFYKWEYNVPLKIRVQRAGGLAAGHHDIKLAVVVRTAYIPVPLAGERLCAITI